ncbi:hypothetical protein FRY74_03510 [Vicingus serpentipes]|uniref:Uncharacterized protein n=1 Tax=Vicingus serpentipes TaxID=1926625 RepID=A0A5C6RZ79_9FLAO|nr:hypothetical protein [Vicingus serpentipes]TXB67265.1 hypothetical protein FRY74_03510 [Vicingus serpentipes]
MNSKLKILICPSYFGLIYYLKRFDLSLLKVITSNPKLKDFCKKVSIEVYFIATPVNKSRENLYKQKHKIRLLSNQFHNEDIYFGFYGFDYQSLFLIKELFKNNKVFYSHLDYIFPRINLFNLLSNKLGLRLLIDRIILRSIYNIPIEIFRISENRLFFGIEEKVIKSFYEIIDLTEDDLIWERNKLKIIGNFKVKLPIDMVFIDQGNKSFDINQDVFLSINNFVEKNGLNFYYKNHPNHNSPYSEQNKFSLLPDIPMELFEGQLKIALGICSSSLNSLSSKCQHVISVIDLVDWKSKKEYEHYRSQILTSIFIPKTIKDLDDMLNSICSSSALDKDRIQ